MTERALDRPSLTSNFKQQSARASRTKKVATRPSPVSLRLTHEERARLEKEAAGQSLSEHIRGRLFGHDVTPRRARGVVPVKDRVALARVLSALGRSGIAKDFEALSWAIDDGTAVLMPESEAAFRQACLDIAAMRRDLIAALGLQPEK